MRTATNRGNTASAASRPRQGTRFTLCAPAAKAVYLAGSFNDWSPSALEMERGDDGVLCTDVELPPGRYEYKFVVDGRWCCDVTDAGPIETGEGCVPNDLGTMNRVIEISQ